MRTDLRVAIVWILLAFGLSLVAISCSRTKDGVIAQSHTPLLSTLDDAGVGATSSNFSEQEPSGDFASDRAFVIGFGTNGQGGQGWAVSTDQGHSFGQQCGFDGTNLLGDAGRTCTSVPIPNSPAIPTGADGGEVFGWSGDPTVRADGKGNVVYVSLANPTSNKAFGTLVAAAVSSNGVRASTQARSSMTLAAAMAASPRLSTSRTPCSTTRLSRPRSGSSSATRRRERTRS